MDNDRQNADIAPLKHFICTTLLEGRDIQDDENLLLSGLLDSLSVMSLVAFIEKQYGFDVPFEDVVIENFATLDAMTDYIRNAGATNA